MNESLSQSIKELNKKLDNLEVKKQEANINVQKVELQIAVLKMEVEKLKLNQPPFIKNKNNLT